MTKYKGYVWRLQIREGGEDNSSSQVEVEKPNRFLHFYLAIENTMREDSNIISYKHHVSLTASSIYYTPKCQRFHKSSR